MKFRNEYYNITILYIQQVNPFIKLNKKGRLRLFSYYNFNSITAGETTETYLKGRYLING